MLDTQFIEYKNENDIFYVGFGKDRKKSMTVLDESTLRELAVIVEDNERTKMEKKVLFSTVWRKIVF